MHEWPGRGVPAVRQHLAAVHWTLSFSLSPFCDMRQAIHESQPTYMQLLLAWLSNIRVRERRKL